MGKETIWTFEPIKNKNPFDSLLLSVDITGHSSQPQKYEDRYYGATFPPEAYAKLRMYVQINGWNTLLNNVSFESGSSVVDLGFGDGGNTAQLARDLSDHNIDCNIFGIDLSEEMVKSAQRQYPEAEYPNLIFARGKAEEASEPLTILLQQRGLETNLKPINLVLSNYTLHWVRDPEDPTKFLHEEMFRQLNPLQPIDGEQRHFCAHKDAFSELFNAGYQLIRDNPRWQSYFMAGEKDYQENGEWRHPPLVTEEAMREALQNSGYEPSKIDLIVDERQFPNKNLLKEWVKTMIRPFMNRIKDPTEKEEFARAWVDLYLEQTRQENSGPVKLFDRNLLVVAHKIREVSA